MTVTVPVTLDPPPQRPESQGGTSPGPLLKSEQLQRNLGMPPWLVSQLVDPGTVTRRLLDLTAVLATPVELVVLWVLNRMSLHTKHRIMMRVWLTYVALWRLLPPRLARRGLAESLSLEAHACTAASWWMRLFPVNLRRLRFGLSGISIVYPPKEGVKEDVVELPERGVRGVYLHTAPAHKEDPPVLMWLFGGAFYGGSHLDHRGIATRYAEKLGCDVWLPDYALCPEHMIDDSYRDSCRAYEWLVERKAPEKVVMVGLSSGGGIALRVLQLANAPEEKRRRYFHRSEPPPQPAGAVLLGPFINFTVGPTVDPTNSMVRNQELDLIVTQRVYEYIQPRMVAACGGEEFKRETSPLFQDMHGLAPCMVSYSQHEVCLDDCTALVESLRAAGNQVTDAAYPYLFHGFQVGSAFLPEGVQAELDACEWIRQRGPAWAP